METNEPTNERTIVIPSDPDARAAWVIQRLWERDTNLRRLAKEVGVSSPAMSQALRQPNERLEQVIADAAGVSVRALFPERFGPNGERLCQTRPNNRIARRAAAHVQTGVAA